MSTYIILCMRVRREWDVCKCLMCVLAVGGEGVVLLVGVVCLCQDVQECNTASMPPPSRNDEDNIKRENRLEVMRFATGWNPFKDARFSIASVLASSLSHACENARVWSILYYCRAFVGT